jgi:hypothetical protein
MHILIFLIVTMISTAIKKEDGSQLFVAGSVTIIHSLPLFQITLHKLRRAWKQSALLQHHEPLNLHCHCASPLMKVFDLFGLQICQSICGFETIY